MSQRDEYAGGELERGRESNTGPEREPRGSRGSRGYWRDRPSWQQDPYGFSQRTRWNEPYREPPPSRQDFRTRYREMPSRGGYARDQGFPRDQYGHEHSSEQLFDREPFGRHDELHYYGTGSPGRGEPGPGFTGGAHGYDAGPRHPEHSLEGEYSDESVMSYENQVRRDYRREMPRYPRGPKGYQRSDERLKEDISERLMEAYHIDSSEVTVEVRGAKVALEGIVPSRHMKHAIEDLVDHCPGVLDIDNRIRVAGPNYQGSVPQSSVPTPTTMTQTPSSPTQSPGPKSKQ